MGDNRGYKCHSIVRIESGILKNLKLHAYAVKKPMSKIITDIVKAYLKKKGE